jgi:hypothetical protein
LFDLRCPELCDDADAAADDDDDCNEIMWYDMVWYLFTAIGFPSGGSGR